MKKHRTPSRFYSLALFTKVQGTTIRLCAVETWFSSTRKREAERKANWYNRVNDLSGDKYAAVETL